MEDRVINIIVEICEDETIMEEQWKKLKKKIFYLK